MTVNSLLGKAVWCAISVVKADRVQGGATTNHVRRKISISVAAHYIFCKKAGDTNQEYRAFFDIDSSDDLTYRILLGYYFSDVAISFFQTYSPTER